MADPDSTALTSDIDALIKLQLQLMDGTGENRRGQHPKAHGVVLARFEVLDDIPSEYKVGLFAHPAIYTCYIRFSNGNQEDDRQADVHGMAIKLTGVSGKKILDDEVSATTHDFVLADKPVFFIRNASEYVRFVTDFARTVPMGKKPLGFVAWLLLHHPQDLPVLLRFTNQIQDSPLSSAYWSQVPYAFGDRVCRYSVVPDPGGVAVPAADRGPGYLQATMIEQLTRLRQPAGFDFLVQVRDDADPDVIDNPTVIWDMPTQRVARVTIPPQHFASAEQMQFCKSLSFTPWHALPEHRPLGEINAIRRAVYLASSSRRHAASGTVRSEPAGNEHLRFNNE